MNQGAKTPLHFHSSKSPSNLHIINTCNNIINIVCINVNILTCIVTLSSSSVSISSPSSLYFGLSIHICILAYNSTALTIQAGVQIPTQDTDLPTYTSVYGIVYICYYVYMFLYSCRIQVYIYTGSTTYMCRSQYANKYT